MKSFPILAMLLSLSCFLRAENTASRDNVFRIVERGANHRTWSRVTLSTNSLGEVRGQTNRYMEIETGMHFQEEGEWKETVAEIELDPRGAVAKQGRHKVVFAPNINTEGAIDLSTADGKRFRSHVLGLSYFDTATGQSVLIAEVKDSIGEILPPNQVIYADAFTDFEADIRYTYTKAGFEQDIIFRERPPSPKEYGLNPETTRLQVLTEFLNPPAPKRERQVLENRRSDKILNFGEMQIVPGKAFAEGETEKSIRVDKHWEHLDGRDFLIEEVKVKSIELQLNDLPVSNQANTSRKAVRTSVRHLVSNKRLLPAKKLAKTPERKAFQLASLPTKHNGFVIDYALMSSTTNFTFQGDMTYYVQGPVLLSGTTVIEGGSVVKFTNSTAAKITMGDLQCRTAAYRPAVFTSLHDNSVGEALPGSSGNPWTNYCGSGVSLTEDGTSIANVRFSFSERALSMGEVGYVQNGSNLQFVKCNVAISLQCGDMGTTANLNNILFYSIGTVIEGDGVEAVLRMSHVTANQCNTFNHAKDAYYFITNSLLVAVTNFSGQSYYPVVSNQVVSLTDGSGVFQTVGAASHYLADNTYRNIGATNLSFDLLRDLKKKTTYAPVEYSNFTCTNDLTLTPVSQRDTDIPDLGYHYDPLDYALGSFLITNCTLTIAPGTAVATFSAGSGYGIGIGNGATLNAEGKPNALNYFVSYNTVQEQSNTNWSSIGHSAVSTSGNGAGAEAAAKFRQTMWSSLGFSGIHLNLNHEYLPRVDIRDSQFYSGWIYGFSPALYLTNNLFHRVNTYLFEYSGVAFVLQNNTFYGGWCFFEFYSPSTNRAFYDNLFVQTAIDQTGDDTNDFNAFYNVSNTLFPVSGSNIILTNLTFETGPLGDFYLAANNIQLLNTGSTNANLLTLFHYTTQTNQVKETNSVVDRGFHYVATDSEGIPSDADSDGISDYWEDINGDGLHQTSETSWTNPDSDADGVNDADEVALGRNPVIFGTTQDAGILNLRVYTPLK